MDEEQLAAIKRLLEATGYGMIECRRALENCKWEYEPALIFIKKNIRSLMVGAFYQYY